MFQVKWLQEAVDELANLWTKADSPLRRQITASANTLEHELQVDPYRQSESRENETRVLFAYPLAVQIDVELRDRIVWILHDWQFRKRPQ